MLLDRLLLTAVEKYPDRTAVTHGETVIRYKDLLTRAADLAAALRDRGVRPGDRVLIALENSVDYVVSYFGALLAGGVTVAIHPDVKPVGLRKVVLDCTPSAFITRSAALPSIQTLPIDPFRVIALCDHRNGLPQGPDSKILFLDEIPGRGSSSPAIHGRKEDDLASIIYTSGTTSDPKGVMLSHKNLTSNTKAIMQYLELTAEDSIMVVLPFYYSYGNSILLTHISQGARLVIDNRFLYANVVLEQMVREGVTGFAGVPSTFAILLHYSNFRQISFPALRYITQAGGAMSHAMATEIAGIVPHARIYIMYGQTEASARLAYLPFDNLKRKEGSVGKGIPGVTLKVVRENGDRTEPGETGEIIARGDNIMLGYWGREEETRKALRDGWLFTGDLATVDDEGYIYILGRRSEMIKSGAHRIAPREIEEVLLGHSGIAEAAVVGRPDPILGEALSAFIVLKKDAAYREKELLRYCHDALPAYKIPKTIQVVSSLPKTHNGKIKRDELRKLTHESEMRP